MHIFLQGQRGIGKSTVILKTLELISAGTGLTLGGFFTWKGSADDLNVYMKPANPDKVGEKYLLASWDPVNGRLLCDGQGFEHDGVRLLSESKNADLIIMDELGYLESKATRFKNAVMDTLAGRATVLGVLRSGDVPWLDDIKKDPGVKLFDVDEKTRGILPRELVSELGASIGDINA